jgi:ATPases with chaperone activity, ATP-binding subunit
MADKPVDAEGARADLGFGNQYFDRWFKQKSSEQKEETFSLVLKYIEEARKKDPSVTLEVKSEKGEVKQVTPDSLAAAMHLAHGSYEAFNDQTAAGRLRGREHLHKSIAILPTACSIRRSRACLHIRRRPREGPEIANTGQQQFPDSFEIRQVMDMMKSDEKLGAKPTNRRVVMFVLGFLLFLGGWVVLWVADAMRGAQPMSRSIFIVAGAGWVLGILCSSLA